MLTRRTFLASALAAPAANAKNSSKIRIATSGFMWQKEIEEGIRTTARMGFHGIEPFRSHILKYLDDPLALKAQLDQAGILLVTCSNGGPMSVNFIDPAKVKQTIEDHFVFARADASDEPSDSSRDAENAPGVDQADPGHNTIETDYDNAKRLINRHGQDVRYSTETGTWYEWTGKRWQPSRGGVERRAIETARSR